MGSPLSSLPSQALSATTAKTIQGKPPAILLDGTTAEANLDNLLSITVPSAAGSTVIGVSQTTAIDLPVGTKFSDIVARFTADGNQHTIPTTYYLDTDGDMLDTLGGTFEAEWSYVTPVGNVVTKPSTTAELGSAMDSCKGPFTLTIKADNVIVNSLFGDPRTHNYGNASKTYTFKVNGRKICYVRPNQMDIYPNSSWMSSSFVWNMGNGATGTTTGGGYTADFVPYYGFKATEETKFPTTGFKAAGFSLGVSNNTPTDFNYSSNSSAVSVDANGFVSFTAKPAGVVTITASPADSTYSDVTYVFNPTNVWAIPISGDQNYNAASNNCSNGNYSTLGMLTRAQLTNSPRATISGTAGVAIPNNVYRRAIGGGIFNEWGWVSGIGRGNSAANASYPNSNWHVGAYYWTSENMGTYSYYGLIIYGVSSVSGNIQEKQQISAAGTYVVLSGVCRG